MTEEIKAKRDELARKCANKYYHPEGRRVEIIPWSDCKESFQSGFDAGFALGLEQARVLVEALEFYADRNGEQDWPQDAIQALEKIRGEK